MDNIEYTNSVAVPNPQPPQSPDLPDTSVDKAVAIVTQPQPTTPTPGLPCPDMPVDSIFNAPIWPPNHTGRPIAFTPKQLKKAYDDYAHTSGTLEFHCKQNHIKYDTVLILQGCYNELREYYHRAQELHTEVWAMELETIADDESRDQFAVRKIDKNGNVLEYMQPNMVASRRDDLRVRTRVLMMERLNPRYRPKSELTTRNLTYNLNGPPIDICNADASHLS